MPDSQILKEKTKAIIQSMDLGRFGLQNAVDVDTFWDSPAGKSTETAISNQIRIEEALRQDQAFQRQEEAKRMDLWLAFMFLSIVSNKEAKAKYLAWQQASFDALVKKQQEAEVKANEALPAARSESAQELSDSLEMYGELIDKLEGEIKARDEQIHLEDQLIDSLVNELEALRGDYQSLEVQLDQALAKLPQGLEALEQQHAALKAEIEADEAIAVEQITRPTTEAPSTKHVDDLAFKRIMLGLLLEAIQGRNQALVFLDSDGQETNEQAKAAFKIEPGYKLVKTEAGFYLIQANQNINQLSAEQLAEARQRFEQQRDQLLTLRAGLRQSKEEKIQSRITNIQQRLEQRNQLIMSQAEARNQLLTLQAYQAQAELQASKQAPAEKPIPKPSASKAGKSADLSKTYNAFRLFMRDPQGLTNQLFSQLDAMSATQQKPVLDFFSAHQIQRGQPIPARAMGSLLKNMSNLGLSIQNHPSELILSPATPSPNPRLKTS